MTEPFVVQADVRDTKGMIRTYTRLMFGHSDQISLLCAQLNRQRFYMLNHPDCISPDLEELRLKFEHQQNQMSNILTNLNSLIAEVQQSQHLFD